MKHLDFDLLLVRNQGSNPLSPTSFRRFEADPSGVAGVSQGSLNRVFRSRHFTSVAAHQPVKGRKICTLPPFGEEGSRIHRR